MMKPLTIAVAGCGSRGQDTYAKVLVTMPEKVKIVAAADLDPEKLEGMRRLTGIPESACYASAEEMLKHPRLADIMLICTPDRCHYLEAREALLKDYDLLLEKPISPSAEECRELRDIAVARGRKVAVCHVLRYTVFYQKIKELLDSGVIGQVMNLQAIEQVGYWHQAHSFVRGNWRNKELSSCMILQKCCHDMDILLWLTGKHCLRVSSFGSLGLFKADQAPKGSTERCVDCPVQDCPYNMVQFYIDQYRRAGDDWPQNVVAFEPNEEKLMAALRTGPYGKCVYRCDNNVVDHQVVNLELEGGATVNFTMTGFTAHGGRILRVGGTMGELYCDMKENIIKVMRYGKPDEIIDVRTLTDDFSGHGGGDARMVREFVDLVRGEIGVSGTLTSIERSVESHLVALAAEESRLRHGQVMELNE
ncbi:MAG: Gfo/Idh/MocA family oxidoreductase [Clostridia bacterium]|nr:Gfo/Idh/MocA family oxidoreductase [Clostridia bacterium]